MSKYNHYAVDLDKAFREAAEKVRGLNANVRNAQKRVREARAMTTENYSGERSDNIRIANMILEREMEILSVGSAAIWREFDRKVAELEAAYLADIDDANAFDNASIDNAAVALLSSGTMTAKDYSGMYDGFAAVGNVTMQRVVANYAKKAAENANGADLLTFVNIANAQDKADEAAKAKFTDLKGTALHCSGGAYGRRRPENIEYNDRMLAEWDELTAELVEGF